MDSRLFSYPARNDKEKITAEGFNSSTEVTLFLITTAFTAELKPTFTLSLTKSSLDFNKVLAVSYS